MKAGLQFESVLKRGLLEYAFRLPDRSPEFRYAYHEVIEEAQHSLMFQEFVNRVRPRRARPDVGPQARCAPGRRDGPPVSRRCSSCSCSAARTRSTTCSAPLLRSGRELHPLLERIMRIHVTEEARHLSFARQYLRTQRPAVRAPAARSMIAVQAPIILSVMAAVMMRPSEGARAHATASRKSSSSEAYGTRLSRPSGDARLVAQGARPARRARSRAAAGAPAVACARDLGRP